MSIHNANVNLGEPHNDRVAAEARDDLAKHVASARKTLAQTGGDRAATVAVIATILNGATDEMPRPRLTSLLAMAMVQLAEREGEVPL